MCQLTLLPDPDAGGRLFGFGELVLLPRMEINSMISTFKVDLTDSLKREGQKDRDQKRNRNYTSVRKQERESMLMDRKRGETSLLPGDYLV